MLRLRCGLLLGIVACLTAALLGVATLSGAPHNPQAPARGGCTPRWRLGLVYKAPGNLAAPGLLNADQPEKKDAPATRPPWQRLLGKRDQSQADQLDKEVEAAIQEQKWGPAIKAAEKLVALREKAQGADHWQAVNAGLKLRTLRRVAGLKPEEQQRFARAERQESEANALVGMGSYAQAMGLFQEVLETRRRLLGVEHPDTASAYGNLAYNLHAQGNYAEAEFGYRKALDLRRKLLGEEHPDTAIAYGNLAENQRAQRNYAEAETGFRKALELDRKLLGEEHPVTARAYYHLANNQKAQRKNAEAETAYRKALELFRKLLGEEHPETAATYGNLAPILYAQGKYAEAETGHRKALELNRKLLGEEHLDTAQAYTNLAVNQQARGKYAEAETGYRKALELFRKLVGEEHPLTAAAYNNLAGNQKAQGKYGEAETGFRKGLELCRKLRGEEHPNTATAYGNLAGNQQAQGKYAEAEKGFRKGLELCRKLRGEDHFLTAFAYNNLAGNQRAQGKYAEAETGFRKALELSRKLLGEEHPTTARVYNNLAGNQNAQGKYAEAETGFRKALELFRKLLGEEHLETARAYTDLALNQQAQGKYAEAEEEFEKAVKVSRIVRHGLAASGLERTVAAGAKISPLFPFAALLARDHKPEAAWQRYEEALGRGTWDDFSSRLRYSSADQDRLTQLLARRDRLEQLFLPLLTLDKPSPQQEQRRNDLLAEKLQILEQLRAHQSHLEKTYGPVAGQHFDWKTVQAALPRDAALVGWIDLAGQPSAADPNGEYWAFLLRSSGPPICERLNGTGKQQSWTIEDSTLPRRLHTALANSQGDWRELAGGLRQQRLGPLEKHLAAVADLPAVGRLIVLPSNLDGLPLEVLAEGRTVSYCLSGTLFAHLRQLKRPTGQGLLALGDPVFQLLPAQKQPLPERGLLITFVAPQSNAAKAELRPGDVLLRYGATDLRSGDDLQIQPPGDDPKARVPVTIWRLEKIDDRPVARTVELTVRPGPLDITLAKKPAPEALAERRRIEEQLAQRGGDWQELPGTRFEVERLARLFQDGQADAKVLLDGQASKRALNDLARSGALGQYRYLHLATHGEVVPGFQLRSRLILSRDPSAGEELTGFDGELTAEEILRQWHLQADLVTLSACETALGKYSRGEGYVGFAQTLLLSGARSVVLSLWKVDDAATALLMERFYRNLLGQRVGLNKPLPKAEALAEAKQWLRTLSRKEVLERVAELTRGVSRGKDRPALPRLAAVPKVIEGDKDAPFAHPYYWAAFVLFGDPD